MASSALADPATAGALARIEAMLATANAELAEKLDHSARETAAIKAELIDLRAQLRDGRAREWLSISACCRRFDIGRAEVLRRIAAGDLTTRPKSVAGHETHEVHLDSARAVWSGA